MSGSKHFIDLMNECIEIHKKKNHDYSEEGKPFSNFEKASQITVWFKHPIDQVFASIIGIKLARIAELGNGKVPNNESLRDSFVDLTNYAGLWGAYWDSIKDDMDSSAAEILKFDAMIRDGLNLPKINFSDGFTCPKCKLNAVHLDYFVSHCIDMHSAIYNSPSKSLKFPDGTILLLSPQIQRAEQEKLHPLDKRD